MSYSLRQVVGVLAPFAAFLFALFATLGCGSENTSHPSLKGTWLLESYREGQAVVKIEEVNAYVVRFTDSHVELRQVASGQSVWGEPRPYHWYKGKLRIEGQESADLTQVLSTSKQELEFAQFESKERVVLRRITDEKWNNIALIYQEATSWDRKVMAEIHSQLQGIWEKPTHLEPQKGAALVVEIGAEEIRGQAFYPGFPKILHLLGGSAPCTYRLSKPEGGLVYCAAKKKSYPIVISFRSPTELQVSMEIFGKIQEFPLSKRGEDRIQYFAKAHSVQLQRLTEGGPITQTRAEGVSPKP
jgi:hypothetical protein